MGFYRTNAIDYFVLVKPTNTVVERITYKCELCKHKYNESIKFCSKDGSPVIKRVTHTEEKLTDISHMIEVNVALSEKYDSDFVMSPPYSVNGLGIFNINLLKNKKSGFPSDEYCTITSSDIEPPEMSPNAEVKVMQFLKDFREVYGEDSIELKYGFYNYDS